MSHARLFTASPMRARKPIDGILLAAAALFALLLITALTVALHAPGPDPLAPFYVT